jgi:hypothetical protein
MVLIAQIWINIKNKPQWESGNKSKWQNGNFARIVYSKKIF